MPEGHTACTQDGLHISSGDRWRSERAQTGVKSCRWFAQQQQQLQGPAAAIAEGSSSSSGSRNYFWGRPADMYVVVDQLRIQALPLSSLTQKLVLWCCTDNPDDPTQLVSHVFAVWRFSAFGRF